MSASGGTGISSCGLECYAIANVKSEVGRPALTAGRPIEKRRTLIQPPEIFSLPREEYVFGVGLRR